MNWNKLGLLFCPDKNYPWMQTHAANPMPEHISGSLYRIYFTCRDAQSRGHIAYLEIDMESPFKILKISSEPLLVPGALGMYDDSGVMMGYLLLHQGKRYLYYLGWNLGVTVPWRNSIGLAIAEADTLNFNKVKNAPVLDRHHFDPFSISYPCVIVEDGLFRMWYGSNLSWGKEEKDMKHVIKYATSTDGISWEREGRISIDLQGEGEYAIAKPFVIKEDGLYKMWYTHRGKAYRIGYAESQDGLTWDRKDSQVGIDVSPQGWDSEMICYASVFKYKGSSYMLYNGNGYGKAGFGLAVLS